jgi:lysophospholipase L1-like esterase
MREMKNGKKIRWLLALGAPLAVFITLEVALWLFGWGAPPRLLETVAVDGVEFVKTNPGYLRLVFPTAEVPSPLPVWTTKEKKPGTKRVVLLGESAAAGFPVNDYHLGRLVEVVWHTRHPDTPLEVLNLSAVAVDTGVLRAFAREAMTLKPDALILYAGRNEAIGPSFKRASRWRLALMRTHIGEAIRQLAARLAPSAGRPEWTGLNAFRGMDVDFDAKELEAMYQRTANYLREISALGVPLLLAVPAINLNDWEPGGGGAAADAYREAKALAEQGDRDAAWTLYRRAADLDTKRIRADSRVRDLLSSQPVTIVDLDRWLHELNPEFTSDREFFVEHVHLTFAGRVAVAERVAVIAPHRPHHFIELRRPHRCLQLLERGHAETAAAAFPSVRRARS